MAKNRFMALVALAVLSLGLVTTVSVYAQDGSGDGGDTPSSQKTTGSNETNTNTSASSTDSTASASAREAAQAAAEKAREAAASAQEAAQKEAEAAKERVQAAEDKLQGNRLTACEAHQNAITKILSQAGERGTNQMNLFATIASRVEAFYTKQGKTLSNYAQLVATVNAAQVTAQNAVQAVVATKTQFNCGGTNPTGQVNVFTAQLKVMSTALEQYRLSVKNLIVGVQSVQSATTSTNGAQ